MDAEGSEPVDPRAAPQPILIIPDTSEASEGGVAAAVGPLQVFSEVDGKNSNGMEVDAGS